MFNNFIINYISSNSTYANNSRIGYNSIFRSDRMCIDYCRSSKVSMLNNRQG